VSGTPKAVRGVPGREFSIVDVQYEAVHAASDAATTDLASETHDEGDLGIESPRDATMRGRPSLLLSSRRPVI